MNSSSTIQHNFPSPS